MIKKYKEIYKRCNDLCRKKNATKLLNIFLLQGKITNHKYFFWGIK